MLKRQYKSGAAKRRQRRQKIVREVKRRRTLEELGWSVKSGNGEDAVDEPTSESETAPELQHEAADSVAKDFRERSPEPLPPVMCSIKDVCFHTNLSISRGALLQEN